MKLTGGQILIAAGSLLLTAGLVAPSTNHDAAGLGDIAILLFVWLFSILTFKFHGNIFKKEMVLLTVMPVLMLGFFWMVLKIKYLLMLGFGQFNTYSILLGWGFFNSGLYYDTKKSFKERR